MKIATRHEIPANQAEGNILEGAQDALDRDRRLLQTTLVVEALNDLMEKSGKKPVVAGPAEELD